MGHGIFDLTSMIITLFFADDSALARRALT
jgi:hypothetical protein